MEKLIKSEPLLEVQKLKSIERLGSLKYLNDHLSKWDKNKLQKDWFYALEFFFSKTFMRGRNDSLSNKYLDFTIYVLKNFLSNNDSNKKDYSKLKEALNELDVKFIKQFKKNNNISKGNVLNEYKEVLVNKNKIIKLLVTNIDYKNKEMIPINSDKDLMMILDVLRFITSSENKKNIYIYFKKLIEEDIDKAYEELGKLEQIGDKLSTFVIRDIILLNNNLYNPQYSYKNAFPVDTWVIQIAKKIGYVGKENVEEVKEYLIGICQKHKINQLNFASGLWYLGANSLDILIKNLERIKL
jgi:hypothetical protein